jgi:nitroreductase
MSASQNAAVSDSSEASTIRDALAAALRAPSAHNAQPWRISALGTDAYRLWYAYADKLRADPDDRDGLMAVGAFYETLRLTAERRAVRVVFEESVRRHEAGIDLGVITFSPLIGTPDPLAAAIAHRQCNRHPYSQVPLPAGLAHELEALGNILLSPTRLAGLVLRASVLSWKDRRFLADLKDWTRFDDASPDGMTLDCLRVKGTDVLALRLALALPALPAPMAWLYAQRDVRLTRASATMAVLTTEARSPAALFECGRRLLRSWTLINALGYAWHPMSVVIDQPTVADLRALIGGRDPVAIYRVGHTPQPAAWSRRRSLDAILTSDHDRQPVTM